MNKYMNEIIGKTIKGVEVRINEFYPKSQIFLLFSDDTQYEFYCHSERIEGAKYVKENSKIENFD